MADANPPRPAPTMAMRRAFPISCSGNETIDGNARPCHPCRSGHVRALVRSPVVPMKLPTDGYSILRRILPPWWRTQKIDRARMAERKEAVVVGALGVIGRYIVERLLRQGDWSVIGLSRRAADAAPRYRHISVDLLDAEDAP